MPKIIQTVDRFSFTKLVNQHGSEYYSQIKILSETYGSYFTKWYEDLYDDNKSEKMSEMFKPTFTLNKVDGYQLYRKG